ncbi:uncharacterized protein LOC110642183 [Hevea brasiliensis]|uniref:uncharacterized protein LOC110642183 n=1 Tax=Hevea brasiliensis TaxID=3981 RepID=UPI0025F64161|nr:uncharacterized protein LOC110642183 [Hevea brasiliensis]
MEAKLGRRPFPYELFHKTHTRKGTSDMVDSRAQSIKDAFLALKEQSSQPQEGCNDPPIVDEVALYYQVVGGEKKNRVYGIGSQASIFYPSSSHGSSSTASYCAQSEAMEEEIQQLHRSRIGIFFFKLGESSFNESRGREVVIRLRNFDILVAGYEDSHAFAHAASIPYSIKAELLQRIHAFPVQAAV